MTEEKPNNRDNKRIFISGKNNSVADQEVETSELTENFFIKINMIQKTFKKGIDEKKIMEEKLINYIMNLSEKFEIDVLYESDSSKQVSLIKEMKAAIKEVMGLDFEEFTKSCRKNEYFYARMIFINHCKFYENMHLHKIGSLVNRDHSTVMYSINTYRNEIKYNSDFREIVEKVNKVLNNSVSRLENSTRRL